MRIVVLLLLVAGGLCAAAGTSDAEAYRQKALTAAAAKSWDAAIENFRQALRLEPNDPDTSYNLALALKYKGDLPGAASAFESTVRLRPKWVAAQYWIWRGALRNGTCGAGAGSFALGSAT